MPFLRPLSYYSTARDYLGKAYHSGRHFLSRVDGAAQATFEVLRAAKPIIAEAANIYAGKETKALLNRASQAVDAAEQIHGRARMEASRVGGFASRLAAAGGY